MVGEGPSRMCKAHRGLWPQPAGPDGDERPLRALLAVGHSPPGRSAGPGRGPSPRGLFSLENRAPGSERPPGWGGPARPTGRSDLIGRANLPSLAALRAGALF